MRGEADRQFSRSLALSSSQAHNFPLKEDAFVQCFMFPASTWVALLLSSSLICAGADTKPTVFVEKGHAGSWAHDAAFSPNRKYVLSTNQDLILWDFSTGREIRRRASCYCHSPAFSLDGRVAVVATRLGAEILSLPSLATISVIGEATPQATQGVFASDPIQALAISPKDGSLLTFYSRKQSRGLISWNIDTHAEIRRSTIPVLELEGSASFLDTFRLTFSKDGDYLLVWERILSTEYLIQVFETSSLQSVDIAHSPFAAYSKFNFVGVSNDGRFGVETVESHSGPTIQFLRDTQTGATRNLAMECYPVFASFSVDSQLLLAGCMDGAIDLYKTSTGRRQRSFGGHPVMDRLQLSRDGARLLIGMHWWDLNSATLGGSLPPQSSYRMSPDGKYAIACPRTSYGESVQPCRLWNLDENREVPNVDIPLGKDTQFTPDSNSLLITNPAGMLLWNIQKRAPIHTHPLISAIWPAVSPDQAYIVGTDKDENLTEWSFETGSILLQLPWKKASIPPDIRFAPDSESVLINNRSLFDVKTGKLQFELAGFNLESTFSPDGNTILTWASGGFFELFDAQTGQLQRRFPAPRQSFSVAFLPDNRRFVSREADEMVHLWDTQTGAELLSFVSFADGEWIAITPKGYYKASAKGDQHLSLHASGEVYGVDQWRQAFDRPEIVETAFRTGLNPNGIASPLADLPLGLGAEWQAQPPAIEIRSPADGSAASGGTAEISFTVDDANRTLESVSMLVNGRQLSGVGDFDTQNLPTSPRKGLAIPSGQRHLDLKIPVRLDPGKNHIEVTAFNGISEAKKSLEVESAVRPANDLALLPNLWILAIGVNSYQSTDFPALSYAEDDARAVAEAFAKQKGKVFREVHTLLITDNSPVKPTAENIVDNLNYLRQAGQNDIVLLFVAGHGIIDSSGDFYFLPQDASLGPDGAVRRSRAVSWRDLKSVLDVPSKKIILLDACHSEGVTGRKTRGVEGDALVRELQDTRGVIISSSRGKELSQESPEWRHGVFTYALLQGLSGEADFRHTQKISMLALATYVSERVPQLTGGAQHPIIDTPDGYEELEIARLP
jgi:WD40 repeat protein